MTFRAVLIGAAIAVPWLLVLWFGPMTVSVLTGRPFFLDCGGLEPAVCDQKWREEAEWFARNGYGSGPVTYFKFEPSRPGSTCGAVTIEIISSTGGILGWISQPLCGS